MEVVIPKLSNSPAFRLPSPALKRAGFTIEQKWSWSFLAGVLFSALGQRRIESEVVLGLY